jgi:hypothetical protein
MEPIAVMFTSIAIIKGQLIGSVKKGLDFRRNAKPG